MKFLKIALLGTAALSAVSASAHADILGDLKAAILGVDGGNYVSPTADNPTGSEVTWSGNVKVGVVYDSNHWLNDNGTPLNPLDDNYGAGIDFKSKGAITATARSETAVGDVGASIGINYSSINSTLSSPGIDSAKGWWKLTPSLTLTGGWDVIPGGLGGHGADMVEPVFVANASQSVSPKAATGFSLGYADGPISIAVGVAGVAVNTVEFGASAGYSSDGYSVKAAGWVNGSSYQAGLGVKANLETVAMSLAGAYGHNGVAATDYWVVEAGAAAKLGDSVTAKLGAGYKNNTTIATTKLGVSGGLYYTPVSQLTIGAEGSYTSVNGATGTTQAALVSVFSF